MQTEYVWIDNTGKMVNFEVIRDQRDKNGVLHVGGLTAEQLVELGYQEVAVMTRPDDYSEKYYYRNEDWSTTTGPYISYTPKSAEQVAQANRGEALAEIAALEELHLRQSLRAVRERELEAQEAYALANLGLTPEQLYAAASQPGAPIAMVSYKRLKDIDNAVKAQRERL